MANGGKDGRLVRSRRMGASVIAVHWSVAVTISDMCCVYWFGSERRGECTDRTVRVRVRLSVRGCCVSVLCAWLSSYH